MKKAKFIFFFYDQGSRKVMENAEILIPFCNVPRKSLDWLYHAVANLGSIKIPFPSWGPTSGRSWYETSCKTGRYKLHWHSQKNNKKKKKKKKGCQAYSLSSTRGLYTTYNGIFRENDPQPHLLLFPRYPWWTLTHVCNIFTTDSYLDSLLYFFYPPFLIPIPHHLCIFISLIVG